MSVGRLPGELSSAIERLLEGVPRGELARNSERLTAGYRRTGAARLDGRRDLIAYAVARMPATFAAVSAALGWTMARRPDWQPRVLLDLGSGPGTAIWAARRHLPSLSFAVALERHAGMAELAAELGDPGIPVEPMLADVADSGARLPQADLVVAAYMLGELDKGALAGVLRRAWAASEGVLLLVEPGTPAGAATIAVARAQLLAEGAHLLAPCPNALACPMAAPGWCHFPARLSRSRAHMQLKGAVVPFEDEKFAYLAVGRSSPQTATKGRLVGPVEAGKPGLTLEVCRDGRIAQERIASRDREAFRAARKLAWGDET